MPTSHIMGREIISQYGWDYDLMDVKLITLACTLHGSGTVAFILEL